MADAARSLCRLKPKPMVATCKEDILAARGVKPCISPNLNVLATIEALQVQLSAAADWRQQHACHVSERFCNMRCSTGNACSS
jgi:hypothetical protein